MVKIERGQLVFEHGDWTWNLEATMNNQYQDYNFIHGWTMNVFVVWLTSWDWLIYLFATMDE
jgi:hypothetical protein